MDDNDVKVAASANKSDDNVNPGAVHVAGVNVRSNHPRQIRLNTPSASTAETEGVNSIDNNSALIRKLQGELPSHWNNDCTGSVQSFNQHDGCTPRLCTTQANDANVEASVSKSDGSVNSGAIHDTGVSERSNHPRPVSFNAFTTVGTESTISTGTTDTENKNDFDPNSALIRKLRGELPTAWNNDSTRPALSLTLNDQDTLMRNETQDDHTKVGCVQISMIQRPQLNSRLNDDLESGEFQTSTSESDIAVAVPVDTENTFTPNAVEYDSDAKPSMSSMNRCFGLYIFLALSTVVIGIVGATIGNALTNSYSKENDPSNLKIQNRTSNAAYRERVSKFVSDEELDDIKNPYRKALDWISSLDKMMMPPHHPRLIQRYILAYFYFATSAKQPWVSDCAPLYDTDNTRCIDKYKRDEDAVLSNRALRWLSNTDECEWAGLHCDLKLQIETIKIGGIGLTGSFPMGIGHLPYLQNLHLTFGELEGPLPSVLGNLKGLHTINLQNNKLTGTIPAEWVQSRSLQSIEIDSNRITGTLSSALSNLFDLLVLALGVNLLTGTIPSEIGELSSLYLLRLNRNKLDGMIPTSLGKLQRLYDFDASSASISGTIPKEIGNMKTLQAISIDGNLLTGQIPENFWKATNLMYINMANNKLTGTISGKITTLSSLVKLTISDNQFTGDLPARLGLTDIQWIEAYGNYFNGSVAPQLCDLVENGQIEVFELDCAAPSSFADDNNNDVADIFCPTGCCTMCCTPDGKTCSPN